MELKLHISPCPNDTFMFDAIVNGRIDCGEFTFDVEYHDIEQLNGQVRHGTSDISKISYAVLPDIIDRYRLLDSGSAMGRGNGPLLVQRKGSTKSLESIAVPGLHTTANALMTKLFPSLDNKIPMLFSKIAEAVECGYVDAGVLIHEGRFVYAERDLELIADLGERWEQTTGLPLPLGAIVARRSLPAEVIDEFERLLRRSIEFAMAHPNVSREYVKEHAQEIDDKVIDAHIALFVNQYSLTLGSEGREAVARLVNMAI